MPSKNADKGKSAEKVVKDIFDKWLSNSRFYYYRIPDARTCGGRLPKRPGDFFVWYDGKSFLLDPKELKHDFRISTKRLTQTPRMKRASMAKIEPYFLINHTGTEKWRVLYAKTVDMGEKSIDLSMLKEYESVEEAMRCLIGLP